MKMATLEEEKARQTAIQFCVQTILIRFVYVLIHFIYVQHTERQFSSVCRSIQASEKHRHNVYSGISRSLVFIWHGRVRDGWTESTQHGLKPFMNVHNILSTDEIASSV